MVHHVMRFTGPVPGRRGRGAHAGAVPGEVRWSPRHRDGISAGTELIAYRGTNPYLHPTWDPDQLFVATAVATRTGRLSRCGLGLFRGRRGRRAGRPGRRRAGVVWATGSGASGMTAPRGGGRRRGVAPRPPAACRPRTRWRACFVRVGAIALNAVLAADFGPGDSVVILGQGGDRPVGDAPSPVPAGARVIARRRASGRARSRPPRDLGAPRRASHPAPDLAGPGARRHRTGRGADVAIELSGSYPALREATRLRRPRRHAWWPPASIRVRPAASALGEEFHHNRIDVVASQIGAVAPGPQTWALGRRPAAPRPWSSRLQAGAPPGRAPRSSATGSASRTQPRAYRSCSTRTPGRRHAGGPRLRRHRSTHRAAHRRRGGLRWRRHLPGAAAPTRSARSPPRPPRSCAATTWAR